MISSPFFVNASLLSFFLFCFVCFFQPGTGRYLTVAFGVEGWTFYFVCSFFVLG